MNNQSNESATGAPTIGLHNPPGPQPTPPRTVADLIRRAEFWLNKVGIVLFLVGVVFFFKYALDHEWISELQRVIIGGLLGAGLLGWGLAINRKMRHFSQVLMGGGIATFYITAFSSYVLFTSLKVPYELAFGAMASITALAFLLSVWGDDVILALTGVLGGLLTPFALGFSNIDTSPLMIYARVLLFGVGAIYLFRGWRSLLWTSAFGTTILIVAWLFFGSYYDFTGENHLTARVDTQLTLVVAMLTFWAIPLLHELLSWSRPNLFRKPSVPRLQDPALRHTLDWHLYIMPVLAPDFALVFSVATWGSIVPQVAWGLITISLAALSGAAAWIIRNQHTPLSLLHKWIGILLGTLGLAIFSGSWWIGGLSFLFLALALQATTMHVIAARTHDLWLARFAHCLYMFTGLWMVSRLLTPGWAISQPFISLPAIIDLAVIALFFVTSLFLRKPDTRIVYQVASCAALFAWLWRETLHFSIDLRINFIMLAAAIFAALLLFITRRDGRTTTPPTQANEWGQAIAHILFVMSGGWVLLRTLYGLLMVNPDGTPVLNPRGLTDLATILLAGVAAFLLRNDPDRRPLLAYGIGLHLGILGWSWQELGLFDSGNGFVSIAWGVYAIALVASALYFMKRANDGRAMEDGRNTSGGWKALLATPRMVTLLLGVSTLFVVAGKLFLVDLRYLTGDDNAGWRILLFLGFGAIFLLISYSFGMMTRRTEE